LFNSPEFSLSIGNLFAYATSFKKKLTLILKEKKEIAKDTFEYVFHVPQTVAFKPGQYLEWTLPHRADNRGIRRYFTIASSPTEPSLSIGVRMSEGGSSFKYNLFNLKDKPIFATNLAGDFTLPGDPKR